MGAPCACGEAPGFSACLDVPISTYRAYSTFVPTASCVPSTCAWVMLLRSLPVDTGKSPKVIVWVEHHPELGYDLFQQDERDDNG